jgi:g-D-glutamyl-meso-diaminopimelate peptidase
VNFPAYFIEKRSICSGQIYAEPHKSYDKVTQTFCFGDTDVESRLQHKLGMTGICHPNLYKNEGDFMQTVKIGERGTLVQYVQLALTRAGFPTEIDGIFGRRTCSALQAFQEERGLPLNCGADTAVWRELVPYLKGYRVHVVESGDTYTALAERYGSTAAWIRQANPEEPEDNLKEGSLLNIPFDFPLVPVNVNYSSMLNRYVVEGLAIRYPFLTRGSIGQSVMGRTIPVIRMGTGKTEIFYNAAFHANEWITTPVLLKFVEDFAQAYAESRVNKNAGRIGGVSAEKLFAAYRLSVVPMVNPDGVDLVTGIIAPESEYSREYALAAQIGADYPQIPFPSGWKANIRGVDLNLQFPAGWENAKEIKYAQGYTGPAPRDFVGNAPLSEPESKAVYDFTLAHDFALILAYHTQGEVIYWKYLDYEPKGSREIARYFGEVSGYLVEETPYASGFAGYKDWFIENYMRPGYTIEAGLGQNPLPLSQFERIYEDNLGILVGGMTQSGVAGGD